MKKLVVIPVAAITLGVAAPAWGTAPVTIKTSVSPVSVHFADTVTARVDVLVDPTEVEPGSIRVSPSFGQWEQLRPARFSTTEDGPLAGRTWWFSLDCLALTCVPQGKRLQAFHLPRLTVTARRLDGSSLEVSSTWPALEVAGRSLPPKIAEVRPVFTLQTATPPARYRYDPTALALAFDLVGAVSFAFALALGGRALSVRWASRHQLVDTRSPLVRALELVRQAQARQAEDRRRAVGLLARTLPQRGDGLSSRASEVAWSMREPTPASLDELARTVEASLEEPS